MKVRIPDGLKMISLEAETEFEKEWIQQFSEYDGLRTEYFRGYWHHGTSEDEPVESEVFLTFAKCDRRLVEVKD